MSRFRALQICLGLSLVLALPKLLPVNTQAATQDSKNNGKEMTRVVAHIPVPGSAVRQILFQEENGKRYLYLQQHVHFTVVDVTDPDKPQIVDRVASGGKLTDVGAGLAIAVSSDQSGEGTVPTQTIKIMDMSDPKNPRTVKTLPA
jgi:hypothetical protein